MKLASLKLVASGTHDLILKLNRTCTDLSRQDDIVSADKHAVESTQYTKQISLEAVLKLVASSASKQEPGLNDKLEHVLQ